MHPPSQRVARDSQLLPDARASASTTTVLVTRGEHQTDSPFLQLRLYDAIDRITRVLEPYYFPTRAEKLKGAPHVSRGRIMTGEAFRALLDWRSDARKQQRQRRIDWFCNELVDSSVKLAGRHLDPWKGNTAIDATQTRFVCDCAAGAYTVIVSTESRSSTRNGNPTVSTPAGLATQRSLGTSSTTETPLGSAADG